MISRGLVNLNFNLTVNQGRSKIDIFLLFMENLIFGILNKILDKTLLNPLIFGDLMILCKTII